MRQTFLLRTRRTLLANLRVVLLLWRRFRVSLSLFAAIIVVGTVLLWLGYVHPETAERLTFPEALYTVFSMLFFQTAVPFPHGALEILFFVVPILGFSVVIEGLVSFSLLLWDRRNPSGEWTVALASTYSGHVIVCGLGHVGYRVVRQLLEYGQEVVGVEKNPQAPFLERVRRMGVPVVVGDAADAEILRQVGAERAQAVVVATNNDLVNVEIAMNVRQLQPEIRVVLRMFDGDLAQRMGALLGVSNAFSASAIAAPAFATAAIRTGVTHSFVLEGELLHVSELIVEAECKLAGKTVHDLEAELDLSVVFLQRGGERDMHPADELVLQAGDKVVVFANLEQLGQLERLNCGPKRRR
jgi:Trk K+ transport system NAD-binding subunit